MEDPAELTALAASLRTAARELECATQELDQETVAAAPRALLGTIRHNTATTTLVAGQLVSASEVVARAAHNVAEVTTQLQQVRELAAQVGLRVEGSSVVPEFALAVADPGAIAQRDHRQRVCTQRIAELNHRHALLQDQVARTLAVLTDDLSESAARARQGAR